MDSTVIFEVFLFLLVFKFFTSIYFFPLFMNSKEIYHEQWFTYSYCESTHSPNQGRYQDFRPQTTINVGPSSVCLVDSLD